MPNQRKPNGFTLIGAIAAALVLAIAATFIGKNLYYLIRSRLRTEAKVSIVDNETTLAELIAAKLFTMTSSNACELANFVTTFNTNPPTFPGGSVTLRIEKPTLNEFSLTATPAGFQADLKTAISACATKPKLPIKNTATPSTGTFLFCAKVKNPVAAQNRRNQTGFLDSQAAFAEIRVDLTSEEVSQEEKMLGDALPCDKWLPPNATNTEVRQFKMSYRVFWKRANDNSDRGYLTKMGSKIINVSELQTN
ncbi:MAG: hypothetical protein EBQ92_04280 [Proteobacteria bacterium]|nr:hypothetical protein [Pseudomonadota bacterium]